VNDRKPSACFGALALLTFTLASACGASLAPGRAHASATGEAADDSAGDPSAEQPAGAPATDAAAGGAGSEDDAARGEALDDSGESAEPSAAETLSVRPHPLDAWSDAQIAAAVSHDLRSLGPMSLGSPNAGALMVVDGTGFRGRAEPRFRL